MNEKMGVYECSQAELLIFHFKMRFVLLLKTFLLTLKRIQRLITPQSQENHFSLFDLNFSRCNFSAFSFNLPP